MKCQHHTQREYFDRIPQFKLQYHLQHALHMEDNLVHDARVHDHVHRHFIHVCHDVHVLHNHEVDMHT